MPRTPELRRLRIGGLASTILCLAGVNTLAGQSLQLTPDVPQALVGDEVSFTLRGRLRSGQELLDLTPRNILPPPSGVRVLAVDSLRPIADGEFTGHVRLVFFRVGPQPVPTFSVLFSPGPGELPDTLVHAPVAMQIGSILPAGNPALKDIRPLQIIGGPIWKPVTLLLVLVAAGYLYLWRRARRAGPKPTLSPLVRLEIGPFERALDQLAELEGRARASGNGAVPLYGDVAVVLRDCLVSVGALRHPGLTSAETTAALPPVLGRGDGRERLSLLLSDSDLVKFAQVRPDLPAALDHLNRARHLLTTWKGGLTPSGQAHTPGPGSGEAIR